VNFVHRLVMRSTMEFGFEGHKLPIRTTSPRARRCDQHCFKKVTAATPATVLQRRCLYPVPRLLRHQPLVVIIAHCHVSIEGSPRLGRSPRIDRIGESTGLLRSPRRRHSAMPRCCAFLDRSRIARAQVSTARCRRCLEHQDQQSGEAARNQY
jgi:hypothetical protein